MPDSTKLVTECVAFSVGCVGLMFLLILSYDVARYTLFGRRYLRVRNIKNIHVISFKVDATLLLHDKDLHNHRKICLVQGRLKKLEFDLVSLINNFGRFGLLSKKTINKNEFTKTLT